MNVDLQHQLAVFRRGADELLVESELETKLARGKPLQIKEGFDPTRPDLHLGHTVQFNKLRQLQDLGHHGRLPDRRLHRNDRRPHRPQRHAPAAFAGRARGERQDVHRPGVPDLDREKTEVAFNSKWLLPLGADGMIKLAARYTVARMLERDDFAKRYQNEQPIAIHEFLYPLAQGYDSVACAPMSSWAAPTRSSTCS
jgi:tyrosyl-tRNA synthetase